VEFSSIFYECWKTNTRIFSYLAQKFFEKRGFFRKAIGPSEDTTMFMNTEERKSSIPSNDDICL